MESLLAAGVHATVFAKTEVSNSPLKDSDSTRSGAGEMVDSGINPVFPETRESKVDSNAEIADGAIFSASILVLIWK